MCYTYTTLLLKWDLMYNFDSNNWITSDTLPHKLHCPIITLSFKYARHARYVWHTTKTFCHGLVLHGLNSKTWHEVQWSHIKAKKKHLHSHGYELPLAHRTGPPTHMIAAAAWSSCLAFASTRTALLANHQPSLNTHSPTVLFLFLLDLNNPV